MESPPKAWICSVFRSVFWSFRYQVTFNPLAAGLRAPFDIAIQGDEIILEKRVDDPSTDPVSC